MTSPPVLISGTDLIANSSSSVTLSVDTFNLFTSAGSYVKVEVVNLDSGGRCDSVLILFCPEEEADSSLVLPATAAEIEAPATEWISYDIAITKYICTHTINSNTYIYANGKKIVYDCHHLVTSVKFLKTRTPGCIMHQHIGIYFPETGLGLKLG